LISEAIKVFGAILLLHLSEELTEIVEVVAQFESVVLKHSHFDTFDIVFIDLHSTYRCYQPFL